MDIFVARGPRNTRATPRHLPEMTVLISTIANPAVLSKKCKASTMCCPDAAPALLSRREHNARHRSSSENLRGVITPSAAKSFHNLQSEFALFCKVVEALALKQSEKDCSIKGLTLPDSSIERKLNPKFVAAGSPKIRSRNLLRAILRMSSSEDSRRTPMSTRLETGGAELEDGTSV